jgi:PmbA protein
MLTVTADELLQKTSLIVKEAEDMDKRIRFVQGGIDVNIKQFAVANSRGINTGDSGTGISGSVNCKAIESGEEQMGFESISSRKLIDFSGIGRIAAKRAVESLGSQKLKEPRTLPVLFDNYTSSIFLSLLSYGVSARSVQEGRSVLSNKLGKKVASKNLTIIDDAWMADGLNTVRCDAEGIPTTVKPVLEQGVLRRYLHNSYTAHQEGRISTGNAVSGGEDYLQTPGIAPINYLIEPGKRSLERLISSIDEGLLVRYSLMGAGHSNFVSGDFSVVASSAFYVKNKRIVHSLYPVTIAGNAYKAIGDIVEVGSDLRLSIAGKIPSILVSNLTCTP